ncbi:MAG: hypothetical protein ACE5I1_06585 [bacterium]
MHPGDAILAEHLSSFLDALCYLICCLDVVDLDIDDANILLIVFAAIGPYSGLPGIYASSICKQAQGNSATCSASTSAIASVFEQKPADPKDLSVWRCQPFY